VPAIPCSRSDGTTDDDDDDDDDERERERERNERERDTHTHGAVLRDILKHNDEFKIRAGVLTPSPLMRGCGLPTL
jgi:TATA-binding protein-associated factor Taf7